MRQALAHYVANHKHHTAQHFAAYCLANLLADDHNGLSDNEKLYMEWLNTAAAKQEAQAMLNNRLRP